MARLRGKLASKNENKLRELRHALPEWELELLEADAYPPEDGETYYDNALGKARFGREHTSEWVLGEDSGIEVEALGWGPGVASARWAADGVAEILRLLADSDTRRARGASARASSRCRAPRRCGTRPRARRSGRSRSLRFRAARARSCLRPCRCL